jgi:hypothetical protein
LKVNAMTPIHTLDAGAEMEAQDLFSSERSARDGRSVSL